MVSCPKATTYGSILTGAAVRTSGLCRASPRSVPSGGHVRMNAVWTRYCSPIRPSPARYWERAIRARCAASSIRSVLPEEGRQDVRIFALLTTGVPPTALFALVYHQNGTYRLVWRSGYYIANERRLHRHSSQGTAGRGERLRA